MIIEGAMRFLDRADADVQNAMEELSHLSRGEVFYRKASDIHERLASLHRLLYEAKKVEATP